MMELSGRTAVVVGGGGGIGRGIALGLADRSMKVVVADIDAAAAQAVSREIVGRGGESVAAAVDATDRDSLQALAGAALDAFGSVHVLVTTVGVILDRKLTEATEQEWAWFWEFNVLSVARTIDAFLPALRAQRAPAHIVATSSAAGLLALGPQVVGGIHNGLYTTTKHALIGYTDMLRQELAPEDVGVSVLCPGLVVGNLSATSGRNRPERFGGAFAPAGRPGRERMAEAAMPAEAVGPIVADAIEANRFYIFTHPESVGRVQARHQEVLDDYAFYAERPAAGGSEQHGERAGPADGGVAQ
jgi:NAD(P)-dependent dehydrogenase (short-subunit alcohol dehydrogenase family)